MHLRKERKTSGTRDSTLMLPDFRRRVLGVLCLVTVCALLEGTLVRAQTTVITPDGSLGTTVTQNGMTHDINGGTVVGGINQFHSFSQFDVGSGHVANFNGPASIINILSRVTGSPPPPSMIDGTIKSSINGANLWFMNPSGVVFTQNSSIDITGSLHVSTANSLLDGNGGVFYANPAIDPSNALLFASDPNAFGFLAAPSGNISLKNARLSVSPGETVSLVAKEVLLDGTSLTAPGGRLNLVSVGSAGTVRLLPDGIDNGSITYSASGEEVRMANKSTLSTNGPRGGSVFIRGGSFVMAQDPNGFDEDTVSADTSGGTDGGGIDIRVAKLVQINGTLAARTTGAGNGGDIDINAARVNVTTTNVSHIETLTTGSGNAGSLTVNAGDISLGGIMIDTRSAGPASSSNAGDVNLSGSTLTSQGMSISSSAAGTGTAGNITIDMSGSVDISGSLVAGTANSAVKAGDIRIAGTMITNQSDGLSISTETGGSGDGGNITLIATDSIIFDGAYISANTRGAGAGGTVSLSAPTITLEKNIDLNAAYVSTNSESTGNAGTINIIGRDLALRGGASLGASPTTPAASANAGSINIDLSGQLVVDSASRILSTNAAGRIAVSNAAMASIDGLVSTSTNNDKAAGTIAFNNVVSMTVGALGRITSETTGGVGPAGDIQFTGPGNLTVAGEVSTSTTGNGSAGNIGLAGIELQLGSGGRIQSTSTGATAGAAGTIVIENSPTVFVDGAISTSTGGARAAGTITISNVANATISGLGRISSETTGGTGAAGNIQFIGPGNLTVDGEVSTGTTSNGVAGNIELASIGQLQVGSGGRIQSTSTGATAGAAGTILIKNSPAVIVDGAISTSTDGAGDAGTITFSNVANATISGLGRISSETTGGTGAAGNIQFIGPGNLTVEGVSVSTASLAGTSGIGGSILVQGNDFELTNGGTLIASTLGTGVGGSVGITVTNLTVNSDGLIEVSAAGTGNAGSIDIRASDSFFMENSSIVSSAASSDGGSISARAANVMFLADSSIRTDAGGNAGNIQLGYTASDPIPVFLILQRSTINANAVRDGGEINIYAQHVLGGENTITATSSSGNDGTIIFEVPSDDFVSLVTVLDTPFLNVASILNDRCAASVIKDRSSFVVEGAGLPPAPDGYGPSVFTAPTNANSLNQPSGRNGFMHLAISQPFEKNECSK